jgi:hypothetical protein
MNNSDAYMKIVSALKRKPKGATAADICAATALPLADVRELLPKAADEYSGHLQVTESGEILFHFPSGFISRYRGLSFQIKKFAGFFATAVKTTLVFLFKIWIMLMLIGYFLLFMVLALASIALTVAAQSKSSNNRGRSAFFGPNLFSLIWRMWFFSELTKPRYGNYRNEKAPHNKKNRRPMHKAVFSFIFGEDDPNSNWEEKEDKTVIEYIQSNRGVISLVEYMALTGKDSFEAEKLILSFCVRFSGSPEITEEGVIVYRFDDLLLRAGSSNFTELSPQVKRLKIFSFNSKSMNAGFIIINAVNLIFGSYFLYHSLASGFLEAGIQYQTSSSYFYVFTNVLMELFVNNPPFGVFIALGVVPFIFSLLFWIIPAIRKITEENENEKIKLMNFRKFSFSKIWNTPVNIDLTNFSPSGNECLPKDITGAKDQVIKDIGSVSSPDINLDENGKTIYSFKELESEKASVKKYRTDIDNERSMLGSAIFDSNE